MVAPLLAQQRHQQREGNNAHERHPGGVIKRQRLVLVLPGPIRPLRGFIPVGWLFKCLGYGLVLA
jgi:hypothetical protein